MGIIELLKLIGEENCEVQSIPQNFTKFRLLKAQGEITFVTAPQNIPDVTGKFKNMGLVIWMDNDIFEKALARAKELEINNNAK